MEAFDDLAWNIGAGNLIDPDSGVQIFTGLTNGQLTGSSYRPLNQDDLQRLSTPIPIKTPTLVLQLPVLRRGDFPDDYKKFEFPLPPNGQPVTPLYILGAINTWSGEVLTPAEIQEHDQRDAELTLRHPSDFVQHLLEFRRSRGNNDNTIRWVDILEEETNLHQIKEQPDGSFLVVLGC